MSLQTVSLLPLWRMGRRCAWLAFMITTYLVATTNVEAQVYRWVDESGRVNYSSAPPKEGMEPADLPPIMRGENKRPGKQSQSCVKHGGIDCRKGPDTDGSVICTDGFAGATARFNFSCSVAKLSITEVAAIPEGGGIKVFVRNGSSVAAVKPTISFIPTKTALTGPAEIEPFGVAEFILAPSPVEDGTPPPESKNFSLSCQNCPL